MALLFRGKTNCALCEQIIGKDDQVVATSHFIADASDPLWRFSDSVMHKTCFLEWDQKGLFVETFNRIVSPITRGDTYHQMNDDGAIVSLSRPPPPRG